MIEVQNVTKSYTQASSAQAALRELSLHLPARAFGVITGPSGSGKSTLLNIIGGLEQPDSGSVTIDNIPITSKNTEAAAAFRLRNVGIVFQFFNLLSTLTIEQNVSIPGHLLGTPEREVRERARECLDTLGILQLRDRLPNEVSGGELQRAAVARALLNRPKVILADEPTGNLDQANGSAVFSLLQEIRDTFQTTILVVTHDSRLADQASHQFTLIDGKIRAGKAS